MPKNSLLRAFSLSEDLLEGEKVSYVVCSASAGNVVVYASPNFIEHTGFSSEYALGKNLKFLQGPKTEPGSVEQFGTLIREGKAGVVTITNYRRDGSEFVQRVDFRPVRNANDEIIFFAAAQTLVG